MISEKKMFSRFTYKLLVVIVRVLLWISHPVLRVEGRENIPEGKAVLCANHSNFSDPIWILGFSGLDTLPRTMAKKELFHNPILRWLLFKVGAFPVDRGNADISAIKTAMQTLKQGNKLLIFPEGTRVKGGEVVEPHSGAALIAHRMNAPIVPVYLSTKKSIFHTVRLIFGEPYTLDFGGVKPCADDLAQSATDMMNTIYALGERS